MVEPAGVVEWYNAKRWVCGSNAAIELSLFLRNFQVLLPVLYRYRCSRQGGVSPPKVRYSGTSLIRTAWDQSLFRLVKFSD